MRTFWDAYTDCVLNQQDQNRSDVSGIMHNSGTFEVYHLWTVETIVDQVARYIHMISIKLE